MKKRLLSLLTIIVCIFMLCSCGLVTKTPTTVVKDYVKDFKSNLDNDISNSIVSIIASSNDADTINKVKENLKKSLSNLKVEVTEESVNDNSATVNLDITGISLENVASDVSEKLQSDDFLNNLYSLPGDKYSDEITSLILESINNSEPENRTCTITLKKDGDDYTITNKKNDLCKALWGTDINKLNCLKH